MLDASALALIVGDDGAVGTAAREFLRTEGGASIPDFADVETLSVLRRTRLAGGLSSRRFQQAVDDLQALPIVRYPARPLLHRAARLIHNVSAYDAMYVALADALDVELVTADLRLANAPKLPCRVVRFELP